MRRLAHFSKRFPLAKLKQDGIAHQILPLVVVVLVAVSGTAYLVKTHADSVTSTPPNDPGTVQAGDDTTGDSAATPGVTDSDSTVIDNFSDDIAVANEPVSCAAQSFKHVKDADGGNYWLNPDRYGGGYQCPQNTDSKTDFTVVAGGTIFGGTSGVQAFPNIIRGCSNSGCITSGYPVQTSKVAHYYATSTLTGTGSAGHWDYGYDLWFNKSNAVGPSSGTEIFVNLDRQNRTPPTGVKTLTNVTVGGRTYNVYVYRMSHKFGTVTHTWNFVEYWRTPAATSTGDMDLALFMTKTETITCSGSPAPGGACLSSGWFWTGVDTGTELWVHGTGLRVSGVRIEPTP